MKHAFGAILLALIALTGAGGELRAQTGAGADHPLAGLEVPAEWLDRHVVITESGEKRKARSLARLQAKGIPTAKTLPPIVGDENFVPRTAEEIAGRSLAILITSVYAEIRPEGGPETKAIVEKLLDQYKVKKYLSPAEQAFLNDPEPSRQALINFSWRYECAYAGLWALGLVESLPYPDNLCDVAAMGNLVRELGDWEAVLKKAVPREPGEILDEADLVYRYDWACVESRVKGREAPAGLECGVVVERHRMFNWLIRYLNAEWDDVSTDT